MIYATISSARRKFNEPEELYKVPNVLLKVVALAKEL